MIVEGLLGETCKIPILFFRTLNVNMLTPLHFYNSKIYLYNIKYILNFIPINASDEKIHLHVYFNMAKTF